MSASPVFYLDNYCSPLHLTPFLSLSLSLSYYSLILPHVLLSFCFFHFLNPVTSSFFTLCLFLSLHFFVSFSHLLPSFPVHHHLLVSEFFFSCSSQNGECSPFFFHTHPISPLEAAVRCTLYWSQGTAYRFHYSQRATENDVYSRRGAQQALFGVSQASTISNYTVCLNFPGLDGVSTLVQSDI